jgi:hypothetical protein
MSREILRTHADPADGQPGRQQWHGCQSPGKRSRRVHEVEHDRDGCGLTRRRPSERQHKPRKEMPPTTRGLSDTSPVSPPTSSEPRKGGKSGAAQSSGLVARLSVLCAPATSSNAPTTGWQLVGGDVARLRAMKRYAKNGERVGASPREQTKAIEPDATNRRDQRVQLCSATSIFRRTAPALELWRRLRVLSFEA